ncbi:MAG TPA: AraC family transcriptional regulator [Steroidobacteraceae bacterium]|jgi:AraC-like DNA-binding protein
MDGSGFPIALTLTLLELLEEWGIDTSAVLARAAVARSALMRPGGSIAREQHLAVIRSAMEVSRRRDLGLHFGKRITLRHYGVIGHALLSSGTIRQVLDLFIRYQRKTGPLLGVSMHIERRQTIVRRHDLLALGALQEFAVEEFLSSWVAVIASLTGKPFKPSEVRVSYAKPAHWRQYAAVLKCPVSFDSMAVELRFDSAWLDLQLSFADPATAELCRERCEQLLAQLDSQSTLVEEVRRALIASPGEFPGIEQVAERLHLSVRTLRRRLAGDGTSFRALDRQIRHALALQYLRATELPIKQIAYLVGYDDPANFSRAFQGWARARPRDSRRDE